MTSRNTTTRDKHRRTIAKGQPPCHWCKGEIDYTLPHTDLMSFQVDHVTPLSKGGPDVLDNCVASHRTCNREKSDKLAYRPGVTFVTERRWWSTSGL